MCTLAFAVGVAVFPVRVMGAQSAPNILLVIADDFGLDASPCHDIAAQKPDMKFVQRMCSEGVVFDNFYVAPVCSPTRATIMTGKYGFRTGVGTAVSPRSQNGLSPSETTIFKLLDQYAPQHYAHAVIGKWHLSNEANGDAAHPAASGVGYYAGVLEGTVIDYYNWLRTHNGETERVSKYITSALTDEAIDWVNAQSDPWFLWLAHVAPHLPLHAPPDHLHDRDLSSTKTDMRQNPINYYFAALEALDAELARLIDEMPPEDQDNLVVIFIGDNGSPNRVAQNPFTRQSVKGTLFEGGVRVPMIAWGSGVSRAGAREIGLVNSTDLFATIAELAGIAPETASAAGVDSLSFVDAFSHENAVLREMVYVEHFSYRGPAGRNRQQFGWAVRDARWKYLREEDGAEYLFDLQEDPYESSNLLNERTLDLEATVALDELVAQGAGLRAQ